jgi:hypothetical protein
MCSAAVHAGGTVVLLCMREDGHAAYKNRIVLVTNSQTGESREIFASADGRGQWNGSFICLRRIPTHLGRLRRSSSTLQSRLECLAAPAAPADLKLFDRLIPFGSVMDVTPLPGKQQQVLVPCDGFYSSRRLIIQYLPPQGSRSSPLPALSKEIFGLSKRKVDQIWSPGNEQR